MIPTTGPTPADDALGFPGSRKPRGPRTAIGLMFASLLAVLAAYGVMNALSGKAQEEATLPPEGLEPELEHIGAGTLAAMVPEEVRRKLESELGTWFLAADRAPLNDRSPVVEPEWARHLLSTDVRVRIEGLPGRIFGDLENIPAVLDEPAPHRGKLVRVWGRVASSRKLEVGGADAAQPAVLIELAADNGSVWTATCVGASPPKDGSWVKVDGVFAKLWPLPDDAGTALHVFSTRAVVASFPPVAYDQPQVEWLEMVKDKKISDSQQLEERAFYGMLNYVRTMGPEGYRELRDTEAIQVVDLTEPRSVQDKLIAHPLAHRFRAVRVRASPLLKEFAQDGDVPENSGNIDYVYRGYVVVDGPLPIWFISPFPSSTFDFAGARRVDVEGFFFKKRWIDANGKTYWLPVLIGTHVDPVPEVESGLSWQVIVSVLVAFSVLATVAVLIVVYRNRQELDAFRERQLQRRAKRAADKTGEASA